MSPRRAPLCTPLSPPVDTATTLPRRPLPTTLKKMSAVLLEKTYSLDPSEPFTLFLRFLHTVLETFDTRESLYPDFFLSSYYLSIFLFSKDMKPFKPFCRRCY